MHHQFLHTLGSGSPNAKGLVARCSGNERDFDFATCRNHRLWKGARACKVYHSTKRGLGVHVVYTQGATKRMKPDQAKTCQIRAKSLGPSHITSKQLLSAVELSRQNPTGHAGLISKGAGSLAPALVRK